MTGARWDLDGAEAVLRLRALRSNGDFESYLNATSTRNASEYTGLVTPTLSSRWLPEVPPGEPHPIDQELR